MGGPVQSQNGLTRRLPVFNSSRGHTKVDIDYPDFAPGANMPYGKILIPKVAPPQYNTFPVGHMTG